MIGLIAAGVSAVGGIVKGIAGAKQAKQAREAIQNYKRQELKNVYGDLEVSTLGAELQREELARSTATSVQALQQGGARALGIGVGRVQEIAVDQSRQIGSDLDRQKQTIDQLKAGGEADLQSMRERREEADLAGLGNQLNVGQQNLMGGIGDVAGAFTAGATSGATGAAGKTNPYLDASGNVKAEQTTANNPFQVNNPLFTQPPQLPY